MIHYIHNYFLEDLHPITIDLVGVGGTGSLIITRLARMNHALLQMGHKGIIVRAWDNDVVEPNNVGRQNFTPSDVGEFKSTTMIDKINLAYGFGWISVNKKYNNALKANIVISCVDNVKTRNQIQKKFRKRKVLMNCNYDTNFYWLDTGNGKDFGQVVLGSHKIKQPKSKHKTVPQLKTIIEVFGDLSKFDNEESQGIEGCSYASSMEKQDLFINDIVSCYACDIIWKLIKNKFIIYSGNVVNMEKYNSKGISISL